MGALLSIPLLAVPSLGTIGTFAASCFGAAACSGICSMCGKCNSSVGTRIAYALIFLVNSIVSWIMLTPWALSKLEHLTFDYMKFSCQGESCTGFVAVQRINLALGMFHLLLAGILIGVNSSRNPRAGIQNGYWGPKIIGWILFVVATFFIPPGFFKTWGNFALVFGSVFLLIGLILLIELVHSWAEFCLDKISYTDSSVWRGVLIGSTLTMFLASFALTIVMYIFFAHESTCGANISWVTINLILLLVVSAASINPTVQEYNTRAGLAQSAMVAVYCTYLCMSAVSMEPDDKHCNPVLRARGARTASIVLGAVFTMLTIAYTTTRAATQGLTGGGHHGDAAKMGAYARLQEVENGVDSQQPTRREMRRQAIQSAVDQGVLPASALDDSDDDSDDDLHDGRGGHDDERRETQYSYALFHIIFFLATQYTATLLTMNIDEMVGTGDGKFVPVGRTYFASWLKIVSSWVCYGLYLWSLVAPVVMPDRFGY